MSDAPPVVGPRAWIGVAIAVTDAARSQLHVALLHADGSPVHRIDLAWHRHLRNDPVENSSSDADYFWTALQLDEYEAPAVAAALRQIARRGALIPYGVRFDGRFDREGVFTPGPSGHGLTCATFVLAALAVSGVNLLDVATWVSRPGDRQWHAHIVALLEHHRSRGLYGVTEADVRAVRGESAAVRIRPEDAAAAATLEAAAWPADLATVDPLARMLGDALLKHT